MKNKQSKKILIIGSGPIVIGQACEFDYSGSQACKALLEEGHEIVLINSNPATIMTDPQMSHHTYMEPLTSQIITEIIKKERPQALLPTLGGQTGLNMARELSEQGILDQYEVELMGVSFQAIARAEDRDLFKKTMEGIGLEILKSQHLSSVSQALDFAQEVGYPVIIRPSYTLGGMGGGIANNPRELQEMAHLGIESSPVGMILVEESALGWKEIEMEVMRDVEDNVVMVCSMENLDPMGVHTGDSITIAPALTLTDGEYQKLRSASFAIIRAIGVEAGGANIQFALEPTTGRMVIVEMNPRVSRSSALASKATGYPIARLATKLALGYPLHELPNDITQKTQAFFEPVLDYVVVKIPRWNFEKFPGAIDNLSTQMKAVGEVMAIGRNFKEALQKGLRSLEEGYIGLSWPMGLPDSLIEKGLAYPNPLRIFCIKEALKMGKKIEEIQSLTGIDPWFLYQIKELIQIEEIIKQDPQLKKETLLLAKREGFSDLQLAQLLQIEVSTIQEKRREMGVKPTYKAVDTCAAEFEALTPYYYSTYEVEDELESKEKGGIMILGGGPNRIGQGIEFDYCCVQAAQALKDMQERVIMVNCNPETVSTDFDISDGLFFEPLTLEDVLHIYHSQKPQGVILQFGGQTPLRLAWDLEKNGVPILGTRVKDIDLAEDREKFSRIVEELNLKQPPHDSAFSPKEALDIGRRMGYPLLIRPSYVLGGEAMEIVYSQEDLEAYLKKGRRSGNPYPLLMDRFLQGGIEVDVDALSDGQDTIIGGIMEHVEAAGVHSGDSAVSLPPYSLPFSIQEEIRSITTLLAKRLKIVGLLNIQLAVKDGEIFILEVNPRASRTIPFVSKALGVPLAKKATQIMMGKTLKEMDLKEVTPKHVAVKEAVFPFSRFPGIDILLGPEMHSTGEVMGIGADFPSAFFRAQEAAGTILPRTGTVLLFVEEWEEMVPVAGGLRELGFQLLIPFSTSTLWKKKGIYAREMRKKEALSRIKEKGIHLVISTRKKDRDIRLQALLHKTAVITTPRGARAALLAISKMHRGEIPVSSLQEYYQG